nr:hypothetical protein CFP56_04503 [Quercus suber]
MYGVTVRARNSHDMPDPTGCRISCSRIVVPDQQGLAARKLAEPCEYARRCARERRGFGRAQSRIPGPTHTTISERFLTSHDVGPIGANSEWESRSLRRSGVGAEPGVLAAGAGHVVLDTAWQPLVMLSCMSFLSRFIQEDSCIGHRVDVRDTFEFLGQIP